MRINLTKGRIDEFALTPNVKQSFLWDSAVPGLGVRATASRKSFIFQSRLAGKVLRVTVGDVRSWGIDKARAEARRLATLVDQGTDPRLEKKERLGALEAQRWEEQRRSVTLGEAWAVYIEARRSRWGEHHLADHFKVANPGGEARKRGKGKTKPGSLSPLMPLKLSELTPVTVRNWLQEESAVRPTQSRLAFALLRAFLHWCNDVPEFKGLCTSDACSTRLAKQILPRKGAKNDCLQREQLEAWFSAVRQISNPVISAYLQILLLTGARRGELATLRWDGVDFQWGTLTIRDKVQEERTIPLTPYIASLLQKLPLRDEWVFSSPTAKSGYLQAPTRQHGKALDVAGIEGLTLHGLRRSFGTLSEWVEVPAGIVAQIQGHKPSATVEKHYRKRPLDLLKQWHIKIEEWILKEAEIIFETQVVGKHLRAVK